MKKPSIFKNPILWFIILPIIVVPICGLFFDIRPDAVANYLIHQYAMQHEIHMIQEKIDMLEKPKSEVSSQEQEILKDLYLSRNQAEESLHDFGVYEISWGNYTMPFSPAGGMRRGFVLFILIAFYSLGLAITWMVNVPVYIRYGCLSTGTVLTVINIMQWVMVALTVPTWYSRVAATIFIIAFVVGVIWCWIYFLRNYFVKNK